MKQQSERSSKTDSTGSLNRMGRPLAGLERICKLFGRMKCGSTMMVWDYANEMAVPESEMPQGGRRWSISEKAKWSNAAGGALATSGKQHPSSASIITNPPQSISNTQPCGINTVNSEKPA